LHGNSVLLTTTEDRLVPSIRIYDWGDSVIGSPFASLLILLRALQDQLDATADDPRLCQVRDAYLEIFADLGPTSHLIRLVDIACKVSRVTRSLTWAKALELDPEANPDWVMAHFEWMKSVPRDHYLT
jgi:hypothetical protein